MGACIDTRRAQRLMAESAMEVNRDRKPIPRNGGSAECDIPGHTGNRRGDVRVDSRCQGGRCGRGTRATFPRCQMHWNPL